MGNRGKEPCWTPERWCSKLEGKIMGPRSLCLLFFQILLLLMSACGSSPTPVPAGTEPPASPSATPMSTTLLPIPKATPLQLPAGSRLGAILGGTGRVERSLLTYADLMSGTSTAPVDDSAFALPEEAAMPGVVFEGNLQLSAGSESASRVVQDDLNYAADPARLQLPPFDLQFVQDGSYLIPVSQGLVFTGNPYWNGRSWGIMGMRVPPSRSPWWNATRTAPIME